VVGFEVEFIPEPPPMAFRDPDGVAPISDRREHAYLLQYQARIDWIVLDRTGPPSHRLVPNSVTLGVGGQLLECLPVLARQASALPIHPALEFRSVVYMKAIE
jgi:hypothetical protein